eukprot:7697252-Alexandrium_andersonii.AAC.1
MPRRKAQCRHALTQRADRRSPPSIARCGNGVHVRPARVSSAIATARPVESAHAVPGLMQSFTS